MEIPSNIKACIENEMKSFESFFSKQLATKVLLLKIIINYVIRSKGKQLRPMLVFLAAKLNGEISEKTYIAASLIELLHTATLIHDDVVDETYRRRGFFSINTLWRSKMAVLTGDYVLSSGLMVALKYKQFDVLEVISSAVREMSEGELIQFEKARRLDITEEIYYEIIRKKTATLISACTKSGAYSVGASEEQVDKMHLFGENLGMAFQIRDDLLDYEKTNLAGKPTGNDLKEKKITLPLIYLLNNSTKAEKNSILKTIGRYHNDERKIIPIIKRVKESGGIEYSRKEMVRFQHNALDILNTYSESEIREALRELVYFITERDG
jgi:octaprenyl-diphosphate synthase